MKSPRFSAQVLADVVAKGWSEVFVDEHGVERVRLTPAGMRAIGVDAAEIAKVVESERRAGRPYKAEA